MNFATVISIIMKVITYGGGFATALGYATAGQVSTGTTALTSILGGVAGLAGLVHSITSNSTAAVTQQAVDAGAVPASAVAPGVLPNSPHARKG